MKKLRPLHHIARRAQGCVRLVNVGSGAYFDFSEIPDRAKSRRIRTIPTAVDVQIMPVAHRFAEFTPDFVQNAETGLVFG